MTTLRGVMFCHLGRTRYRGHQMPSGLRVHATANGRDTLCGCPIPERKEKHNTHAVRWLGVGAVRCARCREKLLAKHWVEAEGAAAMIAEQVLLHGLDMPLLGIELEAQGFTAKADDSGWPSLGSGSFSLAAIVHVADYADCGAIYYELSRRLTARLRGGTGTVNLCVRHSTADDDAVEAAWRLGAGEEDTPCHG